MPMDPRALILEVLKSSPNQKNTICREPKILVPTLNARETRKVNPNKIISRIGEKVRPISRVILNEISNLGQGMDA